MGSTFSTCLQDQCGVELNVEQQLSLRGRPRQLCSGLCFDFQLLVVTSWNIRSMVCMKMLRRSGMGFFKINHHTIAIVYTHKPLIKFTQEPSVRAHNLTACVHVGRLASNKRVSGGVVVGKRNFGKGWTLVRVHVHLSFSSLCVWSVEYNTPQQ